MNFTQRLAFFVLGIVIGSVFVGYIMQQRRTVAAERKQADAAVAPVGAEAIQRAVVPGIMTAYNQRRVPMQSEFIKSIVEVPDEPRTGFTERYLLLRGIEPEQLIAIREVAPSDADKVWGKLDDVRIFAADRVQVRIPETATREQFAAALEPLGMHIIRGLPKNAEDPSAPAEVALEEGKGTRWETPADVTETNLYLVGFPVESAASALEASKALSHLDIVASIDFDYLDAGNRFRKEAAPTTAPAAAN